MMDELQTSSSHHISQNPRVLSTWGSMHMDDEMQTSSSLHIGWGPCVASYGTACRKGKQKKRKDYASKRQFNESIQ